VPARLCEDLPLARGERVLALAERGGREAGIHHPLPRDGGADGARQLARRRVLQQKARGTGLHRASQVARPVEGGEHQHPNARQLLVQRGGHVEPAPPRQADVEQSHVGFRPAGMTFVTPASSN
jgi:hypothetical protein